MYQKVLAPINVAHTKKLAQEIQTNVDLAGIYSAGFCVQSIGLDAPSEVVYGLKEFERKMSEFAKAINSRAGTKTSTAAIVELGAHITGHFFAPNDGYVASHSDHSVFLVR